MSRPNPLWKIFTLHCDEASALASRAMDEPLGVADRLALAGHRVACAPCRRFRRQLEILRNACRGRGALAPPGGDGPTEGDAGAWDLSPEARTRIAAAVRDALVRDGEAPGPGPI